ncbi:MAG: dTMP kinase [Methylococcaceae bacterium]|nr:dTMP kinase [Methylococcaceae bacterium]
MNEGKFITLEGGEGVGKSTNMLFIKEQLEKEGIKVITTREPGGTGFAEKIRALLLEKNREEKVTEKAELLLMFAARAQHIDFIIQPALTKGLWVLCDRFTDATYAYQGGGRSMDMKMIAWLEDKVQGSLRPDLTLLLDAPIDVGIDRASQRGKLDRFESEKSSFFEKVREVYLQRAKLYPQVIKVINADQDLDKVQGEIRIQLQKLLVIE